MVLWVYRQTGHAVAVAAMSVLELHNGLDSDFAPCPKSADIVAKVFLGCRRKILRAAGAFCPRRREGPYRSIQNQSWTSVAPLKTEAGAEKSKVRLLQQYLLNSEVAVSFDTSANNSTNAEMGMPGACADSVFRTRRGLNPLFNCVPE